ncbi:Fe-S protein maturation auxiliary factor YitW [Candidatus Hydrogenisulfobacillus filiaventi]|uniref:Fe-S protein maturation auxiliary factor YitW n=1 Tax=Candidatus Hydrogenisulfobacillus filiaventi TaxID=2707344 RepID=A0A6F8ZE79_9FIRM|nr:iron-sulfur cluster assembly protein [Bacillota bacterium]CAB1128178.1 Fe-S protein maturation auxiliary factor YitW [Candidatus Hydrogenisulfobacillus filiaventi]
MAWTKEAIEHQLEEVYDPEVGLNIVEMGLVYDLQVDEAGNVRVLMTLTTPGCPMHGSIAEGVERLLNGLPGIGKVQVDLTFDPPWEPRMMKESALHKLGWT